MAVHRRDLESDTIAAATAIDAIEREPSLRDMERDSGTFGHACLCAVLHLGAEDIHGYLRREALHGDSLGHLALREQAGRVVRRSKTPPSRAHGRPSPVRQAGYLLKDLTVK